MKKKFINGFLMAALFFAATSSFVSCKDNIDDEVSPIYNALAQRTQDLQAKIDSLKKVIENQEYTINNYNTYIDTTINNYFTTYNTYIDTTIIYKINHYDSVISVINNNITNITINVDSINNVLNNIELNLNNMSDSLGTLWSRVDSIIGVLDNIIGALDNGTLVTGVNIETTRNDVLGIINIPALKVNALAAYYGTNETNIDKFPYAGYDFNVGGNKLACYLDKSELPYSGYTTFESDFITEAYGNAGQIYFTVNSTDYENFDITKFTKITVENSAGEVAPIKLNVKKSSARINYDFGRAFLTETGNSVNNGFYVADATIAEKDLKPNSFNINKFVDLNKLQTEIKARIKDIRDIEGEPNKNDKVLIKNAVREIAGLVFGLFHNDLTAVDKATNMSYAPQRLAFFAEKDGKEKRIAQTPIELFTTAVKPLSYNTFWEYENTKEENWVIEEYLERSVAWLAKKIKEKFGNIGAEVQITGLDEANQAVLVSLNGKVEKLIINDATYWTDFKKGLTANGGIDEINSKLAKVLKTYTLGHAADVVSERINKYLDSASDYLTNLIQKHLFTRAVAPIIIFETNTGMDRLCEGMIFNKGVMHAYLTSGTMEVLAPAYRKYVALVKNGQLLQSEVLPGNTQTYDFDLTEKGDYTVILSCVDYYGYVITKKYPVYVK